MPMVTDPTQAPRGVIFAVDSRGSEIGDCYSHSVEQGDWSWMHLALSSEDARSWITKDAGIPLAEARALIADHARPRCTFSEQGILFIGRGVNLDPASVPEDMKSIRVWLDDSQIVTVIKRRMRSAEAIAERFGTPNRPGSPAELLFQLFAEMVDRIAPIVQELGDRFDEVYDAVIDDELQTPDTAALSPLRLRAVAMHRYLLPLYDASVTLCAAPQITKDHSIRAEANLIRERIGRIVEELAALDSKAMVTRDEIISQRADSLNQRVYILTVLAGVCLPLSVVTGMLGMNVGGVPLASSGIGFLITSVGMLVFAAITLAVLRMIKWI
jgi:zinc transporter